MKARIRFIFCLLSFLLAVSLCGCGQLVRRGGERNEDPPMFVEVERADSWRVVYHRDSKVMYVVSFDVYNRGTFTLLVNPDGTPMLWSD